MGNVVPRPGRSQRGWPMTSKRAGVLERASGWATRWSGSSYAFALAVGVIVAWLATGPYFGYSDTWQLVINTGTTIVTFLMVFLIQRGQNKESLAIQLKLNELVAAVAGASNRLINVEDLTEEDVHVLHQHYCKLVELAKKDDQLTVSHSIEDAELDHAEKLAARRKGGRGQPTSG
jgi:low affinity Fe/Cu permease